MVHNKSCWCKILVVVMLVGSATVCEDLIKEPNSEHQSLHLTGFGNQPHKKKLPVNQTHYRMVGN